MVCDARGTILNLGAQISKAGPEFISPGAQYWGPQGLGFIIMLAPAPGGGTYQVMHSGLSYERSFNRTNMPIAEPRPTWRGEIYNLKEKSYSCFWYVIFCIFPLKQFPGL